MMIQLGSQVATTERRRGTRTRLAWLVSAAALVLFVAAFPPSAAAGKSNLAIIDETGGCSGSVLHHINFGAQPVFTNSFHSVCVKNVGSTTVTGVTSTISGAGFGFTSHGCVSISLAPGAWCDDNLNLHFFPRSTGHYKGEYSVTGGDGS